MFKKKKEKQNINKDLLTVKTNVCEFCNCNLFKPITYQDKTLKYSITLLIPKLDFDTMNKISIAIKIAADLGKNTIWNGLAPEYPNHSVYDDNNKKEYKDKWILTATTIFKPEIYDAQYKIITDSSKIYNGVFGKAVIHFYPYNINGTKGIACGLDSIQKIEEGNFFT